MMFQNREEAGRELAKKLEQYHGADAVVLALPRGGVAVGREIARELDLPLDIVVTRKIGHPDNPEYAICAVDEGGMLLCNEAEKNLLNEKWLKDEIGRQIKEAKRRTRVYRDGKKPAEIREKTAIIVDDGIATGLTMRLAVMAVKKQMPKRVIVAVPVAPMEVVEELERDADEVIVLSPPAEFAGAVGAHYREFEQVEDNTVVQFLEQGVRKIKK